MTADEVAARREYVVLAAELDRLAAAGGNDSPEADAVRDRMDGPWRRMSPAERIEACFAVVGVMSDEGALREAIGRVVDELLADARRGATASRGERGMTGFAAGDVVDVVDPDDGSVVAAGRRVKAVWEWFFVSLNGSPTLLLEGAGGGPDGVVAAKYCRPARGVTP